MILARNPPVIQNRVIIHQNNLLKRSFTLKKTYTLVQILLLTFIILLFTSGFSVFEDTGNRDKSQNNGLTLNPISIMISEKLNKTSFIQTNLFEFSGLGDNKSSISQFVNHSILLTLNSDNLKQFLSISKDNIELSIPVSENQNYTLELTKVSLFSKDFAMISKNSNDERFVPQYLGVHYRGVLKGDNNSWAAISIFNNFVMGIIATGNGNYVLGSIKNNRNESTNDYILYNDRDLVKHSNFKCGDGDMEDKFVRNNKIPLKSEGNINDYSTVDSVAMYFETDNQMYQDANGNLTLLANYVSGIFNQVAALYQNEQLPLKLSNIGYWNHQDPYANDTDSYTILQRFGYNLQDNFSGDLAHLLSTGHNQALGGIAWINVLCTQYNSTNYSGRFAFSNIENTYTPYPTYSWTVTCVAHETGHNFGSFHTHACHWRIPQGGIGALDSCYYAEGNCYQFPEPNYNGSLMSYCHLNGAVNLSNGFGRPFNSYWSQPGDTVRIWYQRAVCLHYETNSSETPQTYDLLQNYPNPFNPVTNIKYALPEDGFVLLTLYDITGREVARLVDNKFFNAGIYSFVVDANALNMSSGVYLYRLKVNHDSKNVYSEIRKMVLIK